MAMIDVKTAVNKSLSYLGELMETTKNRLHDVRVEEVVFGDDSIWHVTISFVRESNATELARDRRDRCSGIQGFRDLAQWRSSRDENQISSGVRRCLTRKTFVHLLRRVSSLTPTFCCCFSSADWIAIEWVTSSEPNSSRQNIMIFLKGFFANSPALSRHQTSSLKSAIFSGNSTQDPEQRLSKDLRVILRPSMSATSPPKTYRHTMTWLRSGSQTLLSLDWQRPIS